MKRKAKRSSRLSKRAKSATYCLEITNWDFSYSLSLDLERQISVGPYWEHTSLDMKGNFIHPATLASKQIGITILGDREKVQALERPDECRYEPKAVGSLTLKGKQSEFLGSVPFDAIHTICLLFQIGKLKYLVISGQELYRGSADIHSMRFQENFGPEDIG